MSAQTAKAEGVARASYVNGFNEQFTSGAANWAILSGVWTSGSGFLRGNGTKNGNSQVYFYKSAYTNLDYKVRMKRLGCVGCVNAILVRWAGANSVSFAYSNSGKYSIYKATGSGGSYVENWKTSTYIVPNGLNVLRVIAIGNVYQFFINDNRVAIKTLTGYTSGNVGISLGSDASSGNRLDIDYAILVKK
jgi:hypothetical protein